MTPPSLHSDDAAGEAVAEWLHRSGTAPLLRGAIEESRRRRRRRNLMAASVGLAAIAAGGGLFQSLRQEALPAKAPETALQQPAFVSVPQRQTLRDGTLVELKPGSSIEEHFTPLFRRVTLIQGEALFRVVHNPGRPFIVSAGGVEARDVGTAFAVQIRPSAVEVLVTEGSVSVGKAAPEAAEGDQPQRLHPPVLVPAGNRITVGLANDTGMPATEPVPPSTIAAELSWRVPVLTLSSTPLSEVIPILNRYSGARIELGDPSIGRLQLSGSLHADNLSSFLGLLDWQLGIRAEHSVDKIVLRRK